MSTPWTLAEAYSKSKNKQQQQQHDSTIVDILGFIQHISISSPSVALAATTSPYSVPKCQLWLVDDSCGINDYDSVEERTSGGNENNSTIVMTVQMVLYGAAEVARIQQEHIQVGDLVRFNNVVLRVSDSSPNHRNDAHRNQYISPCFHFSNLCPEPGWRWARVRGRDQGVLHYLSNDSSKLLGSDTSLRTSSDRVRELVEWYSLDETTFYFGIRRQNEVSGPLRLPCRMRRLDELQSSVGLLSNIQVHVKQLFAQSASMVTTRSSNNSNNKRRKRQQRHIPQLAIAVVTDDSNAIMSLVDTTARLLPELESAAAASRNQNTHTTTTRRKQHDTLLMVTNVVTTRQSRLHGVKMACATDEIVLVATKESSAFFVHKTTIEPNSSGNVAMSPIATSSSPNETQTQVLDGNALFSSRRNPELTVISRLKDMTVAGISVRCEAHRFFSSPSLFRGVMVEKIRHESSHEVWRFVPSAKVYLQDNDSSMINPLPIPPFILQCLCGGLEAQELVEDDGLCQHSMTFLQALMQDNVPMKWTVVHTERSKKKVSKVVLYHG